MHSFYQISWVAIIRGGNWLDENFSRWKSPVWELSGWQFSGWEFSWVVVVRVGIFQVGVFRVGVFLGRSCPGGTYPGWEFSLVEVFRVGIVRWESSGSQFSGLNNFVFHVRQNFKMQWFGFRHNRRYSYIFKYSIKHCTFTYTFFSSTRKNFIRKRASKKWSENFQSQMSEL